MIGIIGVITLVAFSFTIRHESTAKDSDQDYVIAVLIIGLLSASLILIASETFQISETIPITKDDFKIIKV